MTGPPPTRGTAAAVAAVLCLLAASPGVAAAQACCAAAGGDEFGLVLPCYDAVVAAQLSWERAFGSHDDSGRFSPAGGAEIDDLALTLGGGVRFLDRRLQLQGSLPLRVQHRSFDEGGASTRIGPGDASATLRWTAVEDPQSGIRWDDAQTLLPFLDLFVGGRAPTGRAPADTQDALGADITGEGAWQLLVGTKISKFVTSTHSLSIGATYGHAFAHDSGDVRFSPGASLSLRLAWLHLVDLWWFGGLFTSLRLSAAARADGRDVPDSTSRRLRLGGYVGYAFDLPNWEATLSLAVDPPLDHTGNNVPFAGTTLALAVQRNFH